MLNDKKVAMVDADIARSYQRWDDLEAETQTPPSSKGRRLTPPAVQLTQASQLKIMPVRWLWAGWLARGKFHVLAGTPGTGKTTIAMAIAATCTTNGQFPDGVNCQGGNVVIWTGEDDPADTLAPRLKASGADLNRVFFIQGTKENGALRTFDPARDLQTLEQEAKKIGNIALLIVDPVVSAVAGDGNKAGDVRRGLQPIVDLAATLDCAALGITHFSKGTTGREPLERVTGSQAYGALARVVIVAAKDGNDEEGDTPARRFVARAKSNIGPDGGGFDYHLEQIELAEHPGVVASYVTWGAEIQGSARDLLGSAEPNDSDGKGCEKDAVTFLNSLLKNAPVPVIQIKEDAIAAGLSWRTVQRAKSTAGVVAKKLAMKEGWVWELKNEERHTVQKTATQNDGVLQNTLAPFETKSKPSTATQLPDEDVEVF